MNAAMDFWQGFMRQRYNKVPYWMYIKGSKKKKEEKKKELEDYINMMIATAPKHFK